VGGVTYTLTYYAENRLVGITQGGNFLATYTYDGDGNRVKAWVSSSALTTAYIGNYFEWSGSTGTMKKYYYASGQRVAMRTGSTLYFLLGDHLGSTSITVNTSGVRSAELRYYPWGGNRYTDGTTPTTFRYTGQRETEIGLYYYGARFYDPALGRFVSPDSVIPQQQGSQAWDRYAFVNNNPIKYTDPSGHCAICTVGQLIVQTASDIYENQTEATHQAIELVVEWFFETGEGNRSFGPENPLTQEVMNDPGLDQFREEWAQSGYQVPFSWQHTADERDNGSLPERLFNGGVIFVREHVVELGLSVLGLSSDNPEGSIDAVGGIIGSLDTISVSEAGNGQVMFEVNNDMGWASATRFPGEDWSFRHNRDRSDPGLGGTTHQTFYWFENQSTYHDR
jgi:RHS repeat-associated protein